MRQQQDVLRRHFVQHGQELEQVGYAAVGIGGCACGVELEGDDACGFGLAHQLGRGVVGEIERHQRLKRIALRHGSLNSGAVGKGLFYCGNGRFKVRHHQRARHLAGGVRHDGLQSGAVAEVDVEVVGLDKGKGLHGRSFGEWILGISGCLLGFGAAGGRMRF